MTSRLFLPLACLILASCVSAAQTEKPVMPMENATRRPTPLHFGIYVTPESNPITPAERFTGFHTGVDFEITKAEKDKDVPVFALCDGKVRQSNFAEGYGGLLVQACKIQNQNVIVLYGHMNRSSLPKVGTRLRPGDRIGILGAPYSDDTSGNRKHLHLTIRKGKRIVLLGYVQTEKELANYLDPAAVLGMNPKANGLTYDVSWQKENAR